MSRNNVSFQNLFSLLDGDLRTNMRTQSRTGGFSTTREATSPYALLPRRWRSGATRSALLVLALMCLASASCRSASSKRAWLEVKHWGYQLQDLRLDDLAASPFDLLVIDYSRDGSQEKRWTKEDLSALKRALPGRLVLAYLSIGEAESYRFYWEKSWGRKPPRWLDRENPDWKGNYKVKYWDPEWQGILFGSPDAYLDKIIDAGFDGAYLDIIDAYEYFEGKGRAHARTEMKELVGAIARYARRTRGGRDFGVFPQNGEELLADPDYLSVITGIGKEDTYFGYDRENRRTPEEATARIEGDLDRAVKAGKLVLTVDYARSRGKVREAYRRAEARGYRQYCARRALKRLEPQPWFEKEARR